MGMIVILIVNQTPQLQIVYSLPFLLLSISIIHIVIPPSHTNHSLILIELDLSKRAKLLNASLHGSCHHFYSEVIFPPHIKSL